MSLKAQVSALKSVFVAMAAIQLATSASGTFVPLVFADIGASQEAASFAASAYATGFLLGCFVVSRSIADFGHIRAFAASAAVVTIAAILFSVGSNAAVLIVLRFLVGLATASLFAIGDAWINEAADGQSRGRVLSIYAVVIGIVAVASQGIIFFAEGDLGPVFLVIALLYCASIVVITTTSMSPPDSGKKINLRVRALFQEAPTAAIGALATGVVTTTILNVVPYGAAQLGVQPVDIAISIAAIYLGRVVFQFPLGGLSDRIDRRRVVFGVSLVCAVVLLAMGILSDPDYAPQRFDYASVAFWFFIVLMMLLGGSLLTIYSLIVAHALDRTVPVYISSTSVTMLFVWTVGSIAGPLVASAVTSLLGDSALNWLNFACMGGYAAFVYWRLGRSSPTAKAEQAKRESTLTTSAELAPQSKR
ncbi:putative MFS family arabinose efflux permease [Shimia isoporae]|uniref:Putative MFS family arabinose efflux permease n=1 Tax=Shimia isoporae TaxID=647720 RepID=A0A4R1NW87_9RHOB|nr:MFS transporter [Shimia isoporae]TCL09558.1 putative MFS family arabinose efflux permease [Shimia isoporae]